MIKIKNKIYSGLNLSPKLHLAIMSKFVIIHICYAYINKTKVPSAPNFFESFQKADQANTENTTMCHFFLDIAFFKCD